MSGPSGSLRVVELVSARLCQAISGSVNRVERAGLAQGSAADRANALNLQLDLLRAAWGSTGQSVSLAQMTTLAGALTERVAVDVSGLSPATVFPAVHGRIILNLLLLAAESLPSGGTVFLAGQAKDLFIRIAGPAAAWPVGLAVCLINEDEAHAALVEGRNLQMALTALLAHAANIRLSLLLPPVMQTEPAILRLGG